MNRSPYKELWWIGRAEKELAELPRSVKEAMWSALYLAQHGAASAQSKRMHGDLRDVMEIAVRDRTGTYRGMYSIGKGRVYALHFFKKKSRRGIATPKEKIILIRARFAAARRLENEARRR